MIVNFWILQVLQGLESATSCVEDMDEWLGIFNVKLRHMREDIESVRSLLTVMRGVVSVVFPLEFFIGVMICMYSTSYITECTTSCACIYVTRHYPFYAASLSVYLSIEIIVSENYSFSFYSDLFRYLLHIINYKRAIVPVSMFFMVLRFMLE